MLDTVRAALAEVIRAGPPARFFVLFGSAATGRARADSDLDLAWLPTDRELPLSEELALQAELTRAAGREVDLVRLDHASTLCRHEVARDGVLIAGDRDAFIRFRAVAAAEFLDFEPALRDATARYRRRLLKQART
ncbi:MAG: nucleotidyltransferase domain-containing protein [Planctomycetes bacterium]|nr:nucleotidyltransferase domain-containing protein [Planctomycetota bacterium]